MDSTDNMEENIDLLASDNVQGVSYMEKGQQEPNKEDFGMTLTLTRRLYTQQEVDSVYSDVTPPFTLKGYISDACSCSKDRVISGIFGFLPILNALRRYRPRQYVVGDIMSGLSCAFLHLPQGLGFGLLASLAPITGLYTTFFPVLLYVIFGTSQHISIGTNAVIALLTASIVEREGERFLAESQISNSTIIPDEEYVNYKVGIAMSVSFLSGLILLGMGLLRLGFITMYLSVSFVGGFTTASAVHITTSQISKMLNIKIKPWSGAGKIILIYIDIFKNITKTNIADLIIALISMAILLGVKIGINERFAKKLKIPIPIDLIVVVIGTIISHFVNFKELFDIAIVGNVPTGLPIPKFPNMEAIPNIASDAFVMAIIIFAMTISMAKLMARLHDYELDDNQELVAYGVCNFGSSFFMCFPSCVAPPRTMILSSLKAKTTLNGIPTAIFILIVLLVAGQLFVSLPIAILAAMIIVAMKDLLIQVRQLPAFWRSSKADFVIWLATFLCAVFIDLEYGIMAGIGVSILTVIVHTQIAKGSVISFSEKEDMFIKEGTRKARQDLPGIKVFYFNSMLYFANAEKFKKELFEKVFHPATGEKIKTEIEITAPVENRENGDVNEIHHSDNSGIGHIIIDCSAMTFIDIGGVNVLKLVVTKYKKVDTQLYLANCGQYMLSTLEKTGFFDIFSRDHIFFDIWDAVSYIRREPIGKGTSAM